MPKKILLTFLIFVSYFALPTPSYAFNLLDFFFPPIQMKSSTRSAPGPALAPEVPSDNTYSNTLVGDTLTCESSSKIYKTWDPVQKDTGTTDANGNPIYEYVDYVASGTIKDEMEIKNLSSDYYRDLQSLIAKGSIKCTDEAIRKTQNSYNMDGTSFSSRGVPYRELAFYRSHFLVDIAKSLDQSNPVDTPVQDYQIAWSCGGKCQDLTNTSASSSCRPVYVSELLFGLQNESLYYPTKDSSPTSFPSDIISAINSYYASSYSSRSKGKSFAPLSRDLYKLIYKQLVFIPKGNLNSKVTTYNYSDYTSKTTVPSSIDRTIPNGAASAYGASQEILGKFIPSGQTKLANSSLCDDVGVNTEIARDNTLDSTFTLSASDDNFANVEAGQSYTQEAEIRVVTTQDAKVESVAQTTEQALSNLVPFKVSQNTAKESFASTTNTNKNSAVSDPSRPDKFYKLIRSYLRPSSWL